MELHDAIGIDPDSRGCVACLVMRNGEKPIAKSFSLTARGREALAAFIARDPGVLVGIEGRRGQSSPLEAFFEQSGIAYYSLPAVNVGNYRTAMVGAQKNNQNDARAVAEFLLDLEAKDQLGSFVQPEKVDDELRILARERLRMGEDLTVLTNRLWKALKESANDLYLALSGGDEDVGKTNLHTMRFLRLCAACPDVSKWSALSEDDIKKLSGNKGPRGWEKFLRTVQTPIAAPVGAGHQLVLKQTAEGLLQMLVQKAELEKTLETIVAERPLVLALRDNYKGMGNFSAALIAEEIVSISRFKNDDHLASYAGLTKRDYSTGANTNQRQAASCNKRLKDAFITFARTYLLFNKGSHLAKYHEHLVKTGMSRMEALKRIARVLARDVYRFMKQQQIEATQKKEKSVA
jgi:transposase